MEDYKERNIRFWKSLAYDLSLRLDGKVNDQEVSRSWHYKAHHEETETNFFLSTSHSWYCQILAEFPTEIDSGRLKSLIVGLDCDIHNLYVRAANQIPDLEADLRSGEYSDMNVIRYVEDKIADYIKNPNKLVEGKSCTDGFPSGIQAKGLEVHTQSHDAVESYMRNVLSLVRRSTLL